MVYAWLKQGSSDGAGLPGSPNYDRHVLEYQPAETDEPENWQRVERRFAVDEPTRFRITLTLSFKNVSSQVAQLQITDAAGGRALAWPEGATVTMPPGDEGSVIWERIVHSAELTAETFDPWFGLMFQTRDLSESDNDDFVFHVPSASSPSQTPTARGWTLTLSSIRHGTMSALR